MIRSSVVVAIVFGAGALSPWRLPHPASPARRRQSNVPRSGRRSPARRGPCASPTDRGVFISDASSSSQDARTLRHAADRPDTYGQRHHPRRKHSTSRARNVFRRLPPTLPLASLAVGQRLEGVPASVVFEGKAGAWMAVDVGAYRDVSAENGTTTVQKRVLGLLRLPRGMSTLVEEATTPEAVREAFARERAKLEATKEWRKVAFDLRRARRYVPKRPGAFEMKKRKFNVSCYVEAAVPASAELRLSALVPQRALRRVEQARRLQGRSFVEFEALQVGDALRDLEVTSVQKTLCFVWSPVMHEGKPVTLFLKARDLPENVALRDEDENDSERVVQKKRRPSKKRRVLRAGDVLDVVYAKRVNRASRFVDVSLTPVSDAMLLADEAAEAERRRDTRRRQRRTASLKVGDRVDGVVVEIETFGAIVDFGASARGVVKRGRGIPLEVWQRTPWTGRPGAPIACRVAAVTRDGRPRHAPRVTLKRMSADDDAGHDDVVRDDEQVVGMVREVREVLHDDDDDDDDEDFLDDRTARRLGLLDDDDDDEDDEDDDDDDYLDNIDDALGLDYY